MPQPLHLQRCSRFQVPVAFTVDSPSSQHRVCRRRDQDEPCLSSCQTDVRDTKRSNESHVLAIVTPAFGYKVRYIPKAGFQFTCSKVRGYDGKVDGRIWPDRGMAWIGVSNTAPVCESRETRSSGAGRILCLMVYLSGLLDRQHRSAELHRGTFARFIGLYRNEFASVQSDCPDTNSMIVLKSQCPLLLGGFGSAGS